MQIREVTEHFDLERVVPFFQPIIDLQHDTVWRYECLARLVTPGERTFLPSDFLQLVERQQSVSALTDTMFHRSADYFKHSDFCWNLNVSEYDIDDQHIIDMVAEYLSMFPNPHRICFEIMAAKAIAHMPKFEQFLERCEKAQIGVFLDHFGATPGNVNSLLNLPICGVKIAGKLISQLTTDNQVADFVENLNDKAAQHNISVIAEHVETPQTLRIVKQFSIPYAQGFYFCQPQASTDSTNKTSTG